MNSEHPHSSAPISELDWRFTDCPATQWHWCDIYEHARDNDLFVELAKWYRAGRPWISPGIFPDKSSAILGKAFIDGFPDFPRKSFLSLDSAVRREICQRLDKIRRHVHVGLYKDARLDGPSEGTVLLRIHHRAPRAAVLAAIDGIVRDERGCQLPSKRLQYLALLRLYNHFKRWGAVLNYLEKSNSELSELNESRCSKAKAKATYNIDRMVQRVV